MQLPDQIKMILSSQVIKGISIVFQNLLKYFNGTAILTFFVLLSAWDFRVILTLNFNNLEYTILSFGSSV